MKIVVNRKFGGFGLSPRAKELLNIPVEQYVFDYDRTDEKLISIIEEYGSDFVSNKFANLEIFEIPDEATDWTIIDYDGMEDIYYVVDGKIYIEPEETF